MGRPYATKTRLSRPGKSGHYPSYPKIVMAPLDGAMNLKRKNPATFRLPGFTIRFCCHALMSAEALSGDCRLHAHGRVIIRTYELHCLARSSIARRTYFSPSRSASKPVAPSYSRERFARQLAAPNPNLPKAVDSVVRYKYTMELGTPRPANAEEFKRFALGML